jgi:hypothetical protein
MPDPLWPENPWMGCDNQWNKVWTKDAAAWGHQFGVPKMRAGMYVMRWFDMMEMCFEARAVSLEPVVNPEPEPEPEPTRKRTFFVRIWEDTGKDPNNPWKQLAEGSIGEV